MTKPKHSRFLLVYGSQTGQAKAIAEEIEENAAKYGLQADMHCLSLTEKKFWVEKEKVVVFVCSTTGDGEPPETALKFWRRLKKRTLLPNYMQSLRFTFLGLGDSNYSNFCNCGQMMNKRLLELGATHFYNPVWADDAVGIEVGAEPWLDGLYAALQKELSLHELVPGDSACSNAIGQRDSHLLLDPLPQTSKNPSNSVDPCSNKSDIEKSEIISENVKTNTSPSASSIIDDNITNKTADTLDNSASNTKSADNEITNTTQSNKSIDLKEKENQLSDITNGIEVPLEASLVQSVAPLSESALNMPALPPPFISVTFAETTPLSQDEVDVIYDRTSFTWPLIKSSVTPANISSTLVMTAKDAVKKTLKLELDLTNAEWTYEPGDAIAILCQNPEWEVSQIIKRLKLDEVADLKYSLDIIEGTKKKRAAVPEHIPAVGSLKETLTYCCDIRTAPKKAFLRSLVEHTSDAVEKRRLQELCSRQGNDHYSLHLREKAISLLDLLLAFPSCLPPASALIEHLPKLQPRPYSAASCIEASPGKVDIAFNVIEIPEGEGRQSRRQGICTGRLDALTENQQTTPADVEDALEALHLSEQPQVLIYLRSNQHFRPPSDPSTPIIMIGPGTGVAPFRGFLQRRHHQATAGVELGESWLFYGCRHEDKDFLFKDELTEYVNSKVLTRFCVSFSRDAVTPEKPKYVQDYIKLHADEMIDLICNREAVVYVCGDAKGMAKDVTSAFISILQSAKGLSASEAEMHMMKMRLHKKYLEDVWG